MNKDEFKFLIVNTQALWQQGEIKKDEEDKESIEITGEGLSLRKYYTHTYTESYLSGRINLLDFAIDFCGLLYVLDLTEKKILIFDTSTNTKTYQCVECISFSYPKAITISSSNIYVADDSKIYCLARVNYQTRWVVSIERGELVDMALGSKESLYVLDKSAKKVFKIDKKGELSALDLYKDGNPYGLGKPVNIAIDGGNYLYILEYSKKQVLKFNPKGILESSVSLQVEESFEPSGLAVDDKGNIYVGDKRVSGVPYQFDSSGKGTPIEYEGAVNSLILNKRGDLYILNKEKKEIAYLRHVERYISKGVYITKSFDSTIPYCQRHKVVLEADIPENTQVKLSYYASDEEYLSSNPRWSEPLINPKDALLVNANGKNIWFKIELMSDNLSLKSPLIKSFRVHFQRLSYLRYLPATYQEDLVSKDFLERFLSLFETFLGGLEAKNEDVPKLFDTKATPKEFLFWLSTWLGAVWDENWEEKKWREFLSRAVELYKKRGTREGLEELIEIYSGNKPIIVENFQLRCVENEDVKSILEKLFVTPKPYSFCVLLKPAQEEIESKLKTIKRIIELEKPAHTNAGVVVLQPWIYLDMHTYLGINTYLSKQVMRLGITSVIGRDTVLTDMEEAGQIERRAMTGVDTKLT